MVDTDVCIVGHISCHHLSFGIERDKGTAFHLHVATTFVQGHVCSVACAVGFQGGIEIHAVGYAIDATHLWINEGCHEVQFLGLGLHLDVGFQPAHIRHVVCRSFD